MTVVLSRASQVYTPRTIVLNPTIPAHLKRFVFTLTRESWPAGQVATVELTRPDGSACMSVGFEGGDVPNRDGTGLVLKNSFAIGQMETDELQGGSYTATIVIKQSMRTAVTVEAF